MRKLKLQVQISVDGYVAGPNGEMDWMVWNHDDELKNYIIALTKPVDCIVMGRKLAQGFIPFWAAAAVNPDFPGQEFAVIMNDTPKVVFSKTLETSEWQHATLAKGDLAAEIGNIKQQDGGDIMAYGGAEFVSNLIRSELIDELHLFVNPAAIGSGMAIFKERTNMKLVKASPFSCGIVVLHYEQVKK